MSTTLRPSIAVTQCAGILTCYPSSPPFGIPLGPTNPSLITIAKETLVFRREGVSPSLRLLVPAFSLRLTPPRVTPWLHRRDGRSPTTPHIRRYVTSAVSVIRLSPDHLRRKDSRPVSCYAFFKGWLLLSQPPHCLRNFTSFDALSVDLGTLTGDLGCFHFDQWTLAPTV